ncbi:MAG: hypothetical protein COW71_08815 [Ignavibacteriales bacterium CG18_big_fil_WC_8_21_14_2_50_31_20]|nr:MAG: hypothetical protein COW71_08815 [Ignavibacteriales bacterium CG18_big_fil_WC_8_21_14_2_50_31_20]
MVKWQKYIPNYLTKSKDEAMKKKYLNFIRGVSINKIGFTGVVLTTSSFVAMIFLELLRIAGVLTNAYIGLITYLLLPTLFVIGLVFIPFGWFKYKKESGKTAKELLDRQFTVEELEKNKLGSTLTRTVLIFTLVNVLFLSIASMRMLQFMDEPVFCGTACHSVMGPEWATYQVSPHSRVACVSCHVGEGVGALIDSKLNGTWQMISVTFNLLERPIPTPVHQLRPSRETCEKCHWPEKFYGSKIKSIVHYSTDEISSPKYTTLVLKIDSGEEVGKSGIHWHIGKSNQIRYASIEDEREEMLWVEVLKNNGTVKRFINKKHTDIEYNYKDVRIMDCVDCHNRATHIYEDPIDAVDKRIRKGLIDHSLPFVKREAVGAIISSFTTADLANQIIQNHILSFYRENYPNLLGTKGESIDKAISTLQNVYNTNIHYGMNVDWGVYPNFLGHKNGSGCFRCHNKDLVDEISTPIKSDCTMCHSILANDSPQPFTYLKNATNENRDSAMHVYLKNEFLEYSIK